MTMNRTFLLNGFLTFLIAFCAWQSSLWVYDQKQDRKTLEHFKALQQGDSIFRWEFDAETDLSGTYKLDDFVWQAGKMSAEIEKAEGRVSNSDFWLNLRGKQVDALHHTRVSLRIFNASESEIYFFHQQSDSDALHVSERIKTEKGWQVMAIDLTKLQWLREDGFEIVYPFETSFWGGEDGIVTLFGLSPVKFGEFEIDWLELESDFPPQLSLESTVFLEGDESKHINSVFLDRNKLWLVEDNRIWRTPESDFSLRRYVHSKNPNVLLMPGGAQKLLSSGSEGVFENSMSVFVWLLFFLTLMLVYFYPKFPQIILAQLMVLTLGMLLFSWYQIILSVWMHTGFLIVLCFNFYLLRPMDFNYRIRSPWQSWLSLFILTVVPMLGVLVLSSQSSSLAALALPVVALPLLFFYIGWALVQQYVFVAYILPRLKLLVPKHSVVLAAAIFSYVHFPNFSLMSVTFVMGLLWYAHYQKYENWYAIAISHALLAVVYREVVSEEWRVTGEVGLAYLSQLGL